MGTLINKITEIRNWIGKTMLWLIGIALILSRVYPFIMVGFWLSDRPEPEVGTAFFILNFFGLVFILGGVYLNKLLDSLFNKFGK